MNIQQIKQKHNINTRINKYAENFLPWEAWFGELHIALESFASDHNLAESTFITFAETEEEAIKELLKRNGMTI